MDSLLLTPTKHGGKWPLLETKRICQGRLAHFHVCARECIFIRCLIKWWATSHAHCSWSSLPTRTYLLDRTPAHAMLTPHRKLRVGKWNFLLGWSFLTGFCQTSESLGCKCKKNKTIGGGFKKKWKHMSQIGSFSQVKVKIKTIWNLHPENHCNFPKIPFQKSVAWCAGRFCGGISRPEMEMAGCHGTKLQ